MSNFDSPIPLSEIEGVLSWVDTFKLSRPTKKINRDFSDAVLLAEILSVHYPKLVEMHNYPPRNSLSLKLNNWMTLNRKVLKKLKINLCVKTLEQLANCTPGIIERVLLMVHDKIRRDDELNKSMKDNEPNLSSGGSYYEACGDDDQVLVVPVKMRLNGVLETIQQKVVSHSAYLGVKEELKDAKETVDVLKQKVEHLDSIIKLRDERIEGLLQQLERKTTRRKEVEVFQNNLQVPFENISSPSPHANDMMPVLKVPSLKIMEAVQNPNKTQNDAPDIVVKPTPPTPKASEISKIPRAKLFEDVPTVATLKSDEFPKTPSVKLEELSKMPDLSEFARKSSTSEIVNISSATKIDEILKRPSETIDKAPSGVIGVPQSITLKESVPKSITPQESVQKYIKPQESVPKSITPQESVQKSITPQESVQKSITSKESVQKSITPKVSITEVENSPNPTIESVNVFNAVEIVELRSSDSEEFIDSEQDAIVTIDDSIRQEMRIISNSVHKINSKSELNDLMMLDSLPNVPM